jgi:hypothetical protein
MILHGQCKLLDLIDALRSSRGFSSRLDGRQEQSDKYANDRDHDQQFDKGKTAVGPGEVSASLLRGLTIPS